MRKSLCFRLLLLSLSVALFVPCGFAQAYTLGGLQNEYSDMVQSLIGVHGHHEIGNEKLYGSME